MASVHKRKDDTNQKDSLKVIERLPVACANETAAVEFLERQRWGDTPACPKCGDVDVYQMRDRTTGERNMRYLWRCKGCNGQYTVRVGTIFEDSHIALRHWCYAIWAACSGKKGVSALQIRRQTQVSYKSALFMMHRIRYAMTPDPATPPKLTGTVEADETWVGGKPRKLGYHRWSALKRKGVSRVRNAKSNKTPVMAMVQRDGAVRAAVIADVTARNVSKMLIANVSPDAHLRTDEGLQYARIGKKFASHQTVKHAIYEYVRGDASTNAAESFFSRLKRQLIGTHHAVSKRHLHRYVAEVAFKHNTRKLDDGQRVVAALQGTEGKRLWYSAPAAEKTT